MALKLHYPRVGNTSRVLFMCGVRENDEFRGIGEMQADFFGVSKPSRCVTCEKLVRQSGLDVDYQLRIHGGFGEGDGQ